MRGWLVVGKDCVVDGGAWCSTYSQLDNARRKRLVERAIVRSRVVRCSRLLFRRKCNISHTALGCMECQCSNVLSPWEFVFPMGSREIVGCPTGYSHGISWSVFMGLTMGIPWHSHKFSWELPVKAPPDYPMSFRGMSQRSSHGRFLRDLSLVCFWDPVGNSMGYHLLSWNISHGAIPWGPISRGRSWDFFSGSRGKLHGIPFDTMGYIPWGPIGYPQNPMGIQVKYE